MEFLNIMNKLNISDWGNVIRFHRKCSGLSQNDLADLAGVGKTAVFDIEKGKTTIRLNTLVCVLKALNMSLDLKGPLMAQWYEQSAAAKQSDKRVCL
jgi:y4mF family transcriptional regulator